MWMDVLRFYDAFAKAVKPHGIKTTAAVMCTANVTSPSLCKNGLPYFNDSATAEMVSMMRRSAIDRWISMGTYGLDPPTTVNQIDWFVKRLGADRFGLGTARSWLRLVMTPICCCGSRWPMRTTSPRSISSIRDQLFGAMR